MILYEGGGACLPCNAIWRPVETLPSLDEASRNHAYVLPDNSIWVLNHDGTGFVTADKSSIMVKSEDNSIVITKDGLVYNLELNTEILERLRESIDLSSKQDKLTAGDNIAIKNNVISATVQPYDDSNIEARLTALEERPDYKVTVVKEDGTEVVLNKLLSNSDGYKLDEVGNNDFAISSAPAKLTIVDRPTNIYSFKIVPYTSMLKKKVAEKEIIYNATVNTEYSSGIMVASEDMSREFELAWQRVLTEYNVLSIMSAYFSERDILKQTYPVTF